MSYADTADGQKLGNVSEETEGSYLFHPGIPIAVDTLVLTCHSPAGEVQINVMEVLAEEGSITDLSPFMNTADGMETVSSGFNDDSTFSVKGISTFLFNGSAADTVYVSSNHWVGFRSGSEDLKILRRDGCSTMIYRQEAQADDGTGFLKIRFEGYTVYGSRVEENPSEQKTSTWSGASPCKRQISPKPMGTDPETSDVMFAKCRFIAHFQFAHWGLSPIVRRCSRPRSRPRSAPSGRARKRRARRR